MWATPVKEDEMLPEITGKEFHSSKDKLKTKEAFVAEIEKRIGGPTKTIIIKGPSDYPLMYNVDAKYLVDHLVDKKDANGKAFSDFSRSRDIAMFCKTIVDPSEIRIGFLRSSTGKVAIRSFFYSKFNDNGKWTLAKVVFDSRCASFMAYTTYASTGKIALEGVRIFRKG